METLSLKSSRKVGRNAYTQSSASVYRTKFHNIVTSLDEVTSPMMKPFFLQSRKDKCYAEVLDNLFSMYDSANVDYYVS